MRQRSAREAIYRNRPGDQLSLRIVLLSMSIHPEGKVSHAGTSDLASNACSERPCCEKLINTAQEQRDAALAQVGGLKEENTKLKAEVERLKAGRCSLKPAETRVESELVS